MNTSKEFVPPEEAVDSARSTLALRGTLPKSRRASLEPSEAEAMGVMSGVAAGKVLANSKDSPLPNWKSYMRTLKRFRGMAYRAMDQGKGPRDSKAVQVFFMWGGDAMLEACERYSKNEVLS